jgi:hypothetical protein
MAEGKNPFKNQKLEFKALKDSVHYCTPRETKGSRSVSIQQDLVKYWWHEEPQVGISFPHLDKSHMLGYKNKSCMNIVPSQQSFALSRKLMHKTLIIYSKLLIQLQH